MRENSAAELVMRALPEHLRATVQVIETVRGPVIHVPLQEASQDFTPIWAGEGYPRDVAAALAMHAQTLAPASGHKVVVARRLSQGARAWLEDAGISWTDESGDAHIEAPPGFLIVRTREKARPTANLQEFRWTASNGAVAEYLLAGLTQQDQPDSLVAPRQSVNQIPRTTQLAQAVAWSAPQVSKSLQSFDAQGWTTKIGPERGIGAGRELVEPGAMLTSWGDWYEKRLSRHTGAHALWRDPEAFVRQQLRSALQDGTWAISGWLALAQAAPFTTDVPSLTCYLAHDLYDDQLFNIMSALDLRPVPTGARVTFMRADPPVLAQCRVVAGIPVVSSIRLYGDLLKAGTRGSDAADHLRESEIGF